MKKRIESLRWECELITAEIEALESGEDNIRGDGPSGESVELTSLWAAHLRKVREAKLDLLASLQTLWSRSTPAEA